MNQLLKTTLIGLASLRLTIVCLSAAMVLVFAGTLAQVKLGIHEVQVQYFQSLLFWWDPGPPGGFRIPIFPGGHLIGGVLLANLIAAHIQRFKWSRRKIGIQLIHLGLIVMLAGALLTDLLSRESYIRITEGQTHNYSEDYRRMELAVIDTSDPAADEVTAIPHERLQKRGVISHDSLPFLVVVQQFFPNSELQPVGGHGGANAGLQGAGSQFAIRELPRVTGPDQRNLMSAIVEIVPKGGSGPPLGTWLVSDGITQAQAFTHEDRTWTLQMRPLRYYKPYSVHLEKFTHERYPGTQIPKSFSSRIQLDDPEESVDRTVLISMNQPLRYRGDTLYQSGFTETGDTSILQVVYNPSSLAPYLGCIIVGTGLLVQFSMHLFKFARSRTSSTTA